MPPVEREVGASAAQVARRGLEFQLHVDGLLRADVVHGPQDRTPRLLTRLELFRRRRLGRGEAVIVDRPAHGQRQVEKPGLRVLDLDVLSGKGDVGVHLMEIGRLLRPDRVTDVGVGDARAVDQTAAAPPAQPREADADPVDLQHDALAVGIAEDRDPLGQDRAGG